ncbi:MAG: single-stranded DNA-binding protein [Desulfuromonadales bacterium]|nr:single-stranded DNA-binding protein [Desulfuromonadales bacterium]
MSVNKVILVGNLGKDPDLRYTPSGTAVCEFSIATSDRFKNKQGEQQEKTEWHNIIVWAGLAEICGKYLHKGKQVYIEGRLQYRTYDDRDGNKRYVTEIVADQMQMLGGRGGANDDSGAGYNRGAQAGNSSQGDNYNQDQGRNYDQQSPSKAQVEEPPFNPDDDIPF